MNSFRSIVSLFLANIVLVASIGATVNSHLCAGQVQSTALYIKAATCKMDVAKTCHNKKHSSKRKGCCKEEILVLKGNETNAEVKTTTQQNTTFTLIALVLPLLYSVNDSESASAILNFAHYKPPLKKQDFTVAFQVFLI